MKFHSNIHRARVAGFTLVEIYIVSAILVILVLAITATQFFAARVYTLSATKLTSTAVGRKAMNDLRDAIRSAVGVQVGTYNPTANTYSIISNGLPQIGNALVIYPNVPTNNSGNSLNSGTIYFMNQQSSNICTVSYINNVVQTATLTNNVIVYLTNYYAFDAEDAFTNVLTTYSKSRVIHIKLQFCQWEFPLAGVAGQNALYDYYQLQTRATMRMPTY